MIFKAGTPTLIGFSIFEGVGLAIALNSPDAYSSWLAPILAGAVFLIFIAFLSSFTDKDKRSFFPVIIFIVANLTLLVVLFAKIFALTGGIHEGENVKATKDIWDCIYFSIVTITTLGYGDFHPVGKWARIAVASEAIFGYIILGVLVAALSNIMRPRA